MISCYSGKERFGGERFAEEDWSPKEWKALLCWKYSVKFGRKFKLINCTSEGNTRKKKYVFPWKSVFVSFLICIYQFASNVNTKKQDCR